MTNSLRSAPLVGALLATLGISGCITVNLPTGQVEPLVETVVGGSGSQKILMIEIDGVITESAQVADFFGTVEEGAVSRLREELDLARADDQIKALVLRINSPGGTVTGSDLIHQEITRFKRDSGIPVVAQLMGIAASGGYYVAVAADEIVAQPTTVTGSIGVIFSGFNLSGLMEKLGIENQTLTSGAFKDAGSMMRPMRPEERAQLQSVIADFHTRFVEVVRAGRPDLPAEEVAALADGRIFSAPQALEAGLVDQIGALESTLAAARGRAGIRAASVITYHRPREHASNLYTRAPTGRKALVDLWPDTLALEGPTFLYLWVPGSAVH
jgi:protease-4